MKKKDMTCQSCINAGSALKAPGRPSATVRCFLYPSPAPKPVDSYCGQGKWRIDHHPDLTPYLVSWGEWETEDDDPAETPKEDA